MTMIRALAFRVLI